MRSIWLASALLLLLVVVSTCALRTSDTSIEALEKLWLSTGGSKWNYTSMDICISIGGFQSLVGAQWAFPKSAATGAYLMDPCPATGKSFTGIDCGPCPGNVCKIQALHIPCAPLVGTIPAEIGNITSLLQLGLNINSLTGDLPSELGRLTDLAILNLNTNRLSGRLPESLVQMQKLVVVNLHGNFISGTIPADYGNLTRLEVIRLFNNSLSGEIPASLSRLTRLMELDVSSNHLSGTLPPSMSLMQNLTMLDCNSNRIVGTIPAEYGDLLLLQELILYNNRLSGTIPQELHKLSQLQSLLLQNNCLVGAIPSALGNLQSLQYLNLNSNSLEGSIPESFGSLRALQSLVLGENGLTGSIPSSLSQLSGLNTLIVKQNKLKSESSFDFIDASKQGNLTMLDISSNSFAGTIPAAVFLLPSLQVFAASSNCFTGSIPASVCKAKNLTTLVMADISNAVSCRHYYFKGTALENVFDGFAIINFMEGSLPHCMYELPKLETLIVSGGGFTGDLPYLVSPSLQRLDVSRNFLYGTISNRLAQGASLRHLDLSYNRIGGTLDGFAFASSAFDNYYTSRKMDLSLTVNRLSGSLPGSLLSVQNIQVLSGNAFACSVSRDTLPTQDPDINIYECGSNSMDNLLIVYGLVMLVVICLYLHVAHAKSQAKVKERLLSYLDISSNCAGLHSVVKCDHIARYVDYLQNLRRFMLWISAVLLVMLCIYAGLSDHSNRTIMYTETWAVTAGYLSGTSGAVCMTVSCMLAVTVAWSCILREEIRGDAHAVAPRSRWDSRVSQRDMSDGTWGETIKRWSVMCLRMLVLIGLIWGVMILGNVWYASVLLHGNTLQQSIFKFCFAAFKLFWSMTATPWMLESNYFHLGIPGWYHDDLIQLLFGNVIRMMFIMNAVTLFLVPLIVATFVFPSCFYNLFFAADPVEANYSVNHCLTWYTPAGQGCAEIENFEENILINVPFVYNFTCSSSILKAYVPLYQQMFMILIVRSILQFVYLCWDIKNFNRKLPHSIFERVFARYFLPFKQINMDSAERENLGIIEARHGVQTMFIKRMPSNLGNSLLLLTFGLLAPPLGGIIVTYAIMDTLISQLVVGKFVLMSLFVIEERNLQKIQAFAAQEKAEKLPHDETRMSSFKSTLGVLQYDRLSYSYTEADREHLKHDIDSADQSWGMYAVLQDCELQAGEIPAQPLALGRTVFVIIPCSVFSFVIADAFMSTGHLATRCGWVFGVLGGFAIAIETLAWFYKRHLEMQRKDVAAHIQEVVLGPKQWRPESQCTEHSIEMFSRSSEFAQPGAHEDRKSDGQSTENPMRQGGETSHEAKESL